MAVTVTAQWSLVSYVKNFSYTGAVQTFTAPYTGYYQVQLWGASGGASATAYTGGKGAYTKGSTNISKETSLYVYVGQKGFDAPVSTFTYGGWNGGGGMANSHVTSGGCHGYAAGGGGSSDIRVLSGTIINDTTYYARYTNDDSLRSRIMVAAGGGGGSGSVEASTAGYGGFAGALDAGNAPSMFATVSGGVSGGYAIGGNQTRGGAGGRGTYAGGIETGAPYKGEFGHGGTNGGCPWGGGGAGWYGGGSGNYYNGGGAGGSSYISGHTGSVAVTSTSSSSPKSGCTTGTTNNACSISPYGYTFTNTQMIAGNASIPNTAGTGNETGHSGNGYAKITWLGDTI